MSGIDFSALVLAPNIATFGKPVTVTPKKSQPMAAPYRAHGIWTIQRMAALDEAGGVISNRTLQFGIRIADFRYPPKQGDWITTPVRDLPLGYWQGAFAPDSNVHLDSNIDLVVDDFQPDGQGGATLIVKRVTG